MVILCNFVTSIRKDTMREAATRCRSQHINLIPLKTRKEHYYGSKESTI